MKWTNDSKERLYEIARSYDPQLLSLEEITEENPVIVELAQRFGDEPKAVLFMLAKMGFFTIDKRTSYKTGVFYRRDSKTTFEDFSIQPLFDKLPTKTLDELELELTKLLKNRTPLEKSFELLGEKFAISELNIICELFKAGLLSYTDGKGYEFSDRAYLEEGESVIETVDYLKPNEELKNSINKYRSEASKLYQMTNHRKPCLVQSNDGTGFGKSYGVISEYIEYGPNPTSSGPFTNLVFVSPQKSQFDFDKGLVQKAQNAGIEFVAFLAMLDLTDLEFESWVASPNGEKRKNHDLYNSWVRKRKKYKWLEKDLTRLAQSLRTVDSLQNRINTEVKTYEADNAEIISDLKAQLTEQRRNMEKTLFDLSLSCLNYNAKAADLITLFESKTDLDVLRAEIVKHCIPFAIAMVKPCIMLATTNKFDLNIRLPQKNPQGLFSFKSMPFDCIVGGKKHLTDSNIRTGMHLSDKHEQRIEFFVVA